MSITFTGNQVEINGKLIQVPWSVREAVELEDKIIILLDPDTYLLDPDYKAARKKGMSAIRNLIAFTRSGNKLWDAEMPQASDYYYQIVSAEPLTVYSFSSYKCEIDIDTGVIKRKEFLK